MKPFKHQTQTTEFILSRQKVLITSDPGTGKTRSVLDAYKKLPKAKGRMLVVAPLSILQASWGDDIEKFQPSLTYNVAYAKNRERAFIEDSDIVITNHDAVKWLVKNPLYLRGTLFNTICIDEFTAFKNKDSQRSKAMKKLVDSFYYRIGMSGTPNSNTILDIWHPAFLIDGGQRLGTRFYSFRQAVCTSRFNGFANEWVDKDDAEQIVASALFDINIRHKLEDCIDMPEQTVRTMTTQLPNKIMKAYSNLANDSTLVTDKGTVNAVHAGAKVKKLLQLCTGALYDEEGKVIGIHKERYNLVLQLILERNHSLVAFNWTHERNYLVEMCEKQGIKYGIIDGTTLGHKRNDVVNRMQAGQLQVVFCHPQSAGHGLTMTKATTIIWASPTYNAEHYQQFNRRIYRAGQTKRTEVIRIAADNTWEPDVYDKLEGKLNRMEELLTILTNLNSLRETA